MIDDPFAILALLVAAVALAEWSATIGWLRKVGAAVIAIALGALLANFRVIPSAASGGAPYDAIFTYVVPASIFLLLLDVNLRTIRRAGPKMMIAFALGALGVMIGVVVASMILPAAPLGTFGGPVAGMFTGTYIGGSANFNAIATAYGVEQEGGLYLAAVVADNVMTVLWMLLLLAAPRLLRASGLFREVSRDADAEVGETHHHSAAKPLQGIPAVAMPLAVTGLALWASFEIAKMAEAAGFAVPSILIATTLALAIAQTHFASRMALAAPMGMWAIYLFLAVVGATADIQALIQAQSLGWYLFAYIAIIFAVHAAILVGGALVFRLDPETLAVASVANIGGSSTAPAIAESVGREDLVLPGIVVGALGTALGTYAGFAMAAMLMP